MVRNRFLLQSGNPFAHALKGDIKHRNHEDAETARRQHSRENRRRDGSPRNLGGAVRPYERCKPGDERNRRHHHGPEAQPRTGFHRRNDARSRLALFLGELDDQNAVLCRHCDQHDEADLGVEIESQPCRQETGKRAEHADRDRQRHGDRNDPALIQRDQE